MVSEQRYSRQSGMIPMDRLQELGVTIIGCGAGGRNVAIQLAAMGVTKMQLIDFDTVEEHNIASQGFLESQIGIPKVDAVAQSCKAINVDMQIEKLYSKYKRSMNTHQIIFCCVDSISTRKFIFEHVCCDLFIDARMQGETIRVLAAWNPETHEHYASTLFAQAEAHRGACTAKTTLYCASIDAGWMVSMYTKWLRDSLISCDVMINVLADEITVLK